LELPSGTITLVFTDIESSSELSERYRDDFEPLRAVHFQLLREVMQRWNGMEVSTAGDALFLVFLSAADAVQWAVEAQRSLAHYDWPELSSPDVSGGQPLRVEVRVRIGMHTGEPFLSVDTGHPDYFGPVVNRAARVSSAAYGGQILVSNATYELAKSSLSAEITFQDHGLHRLKGVGEDRLWQIQAPDLIQDFPPLKTLDPERHNLPTPPTPYMGREHEIEEWLEKLGQPTTRVLTLTGFGGLGKTRSALQLAELSLDSYQDGVWWVEEEEAHTGEEMVQRIAYGLRLPLQSQIPVKEQVAGFLRGRNLLLVLDNTEQVRDEEAGRIVKELLTPAPKLKFLVTSRRALQIQAERVVEINPLPLAEAVPLFVARVQDRQSDFELTADNTDDVTELCRRLDGVPLALELAASRIAMMAPRQMLQRLNERFKLLQVRAPDLPERQRALRAAIDWSYELLSDENKSLFAQLSVFAGGFTLEDVEAVCEAFDVFEGVADLRRHSLLRSEVDAETQQTRFLMLNSLREYALEKLNEGGEGSATRLRHARYFLEFAQQRLAKERTADEMGALQELEVNADNLRAAMESAQQEGATELFAQLGLMRGRALFRRGFSEEAAKPVQAALDALQSLQTEQELLYAELLRERAGLYFDQQELSQADTVAKEARDCFIKADNQVGQARTENLLGMIATYSQQYADARTYFVQALQRLHSPAEDVEIGNLNNNFGELERSDPEGDLEDATRYHQEAMRLRRKQGDRRGLAETLNNLGALAYRQGDWSRAWDCYVEALGHEQALRNPFGIARLLYNLAEVAQERGETERTLRLAASSERLMEIVKSPYARDAAELLTNAAVTGGAEEQAEPLRRTARRLPLEALLPWALDDSTSL